MSATDRTPAASANDSVVKQLGRVLEARWLGNPDVRPSWMTPDYSRTHQIYGRIQLEHVVPDRLAADPARKLAFIFGPDTVMDTLAELSPVEALAKMGLLREYVRHKIVEEGCRAFVSLFRVDSAMEDVFVLPATWEGLRDTASKLYPDVAHEVHAWVEGYVKEPSKHDISACESRMGVRFIDVHTSKPHAAHIPKLTYDVYRDLPRPLPSSDWTRLFLYNEMRIFELFKGNGMTQHEDGTDGDPEFLIPNVPFHSFPEHTLLEVTAHFQELHDG